MNGDSRIQYEVKPYKVHMRSRVPEPIDPNMSDADRRAAEKRFKMKMRQRLNRAVKRGLVRRLPCEWPDCGDTEVQGHHYDYNDPLVVIWLCQTHHKDTHRALKES